MGKKLGKFATEYTIKKSARGCLLFHAETAWSASFLAHTAWEEISHNILIAFHIRSYRKFDLEFYQGERGVFFFCSTVTNDQARFWLYRRAWRFNSYDWQSDRWGSIAEGGVLKRTNP